VGRKIDTPGAVSAEEIVRGTIRDSIEVKTMLLQHISVITDLSRLLIDALKGGNKLVLFGNGGSAADAQHVAAELVNRFQLDRNALPAIALTTDTSILTSVGNDLAFDQLFSRQVRALVRRGDVAAGISTSGNSPNVINGIIAAKEGGAITVGFTGRSGGTLKIWWISAATCLRTAPHAFRRLRLPSGMPFVKLWNRRCSANEGDSVPRSGRDH
jgi:D-sedoheptulose 7-phosphate isomerase